MRLDGSTLVRIARAMRDTTWKRYDDDALRAFGAKLGWAWDATGELPVLRTGLPTGDARPRPEGTFDSTIMGWFERLGLVVPVADERTSGAAVLARDFRELAADLEEAFGPSLVMGCHGARGWYDDAVPSWGSPFRIWHDGWTAVELRASQTGVELAVHPITTIDSWLAYCTEAMPAGELGGFVAQRFDGTTSPLQTPYAPPVEDDWLDFELDLARELTTLPAVTVALDIELSFGLHGMIPGTAGPWVFSLASTDVLELGVDAELEHTDVDFAKLGWQRSSDHPADGAHLDPVSFHSDAAGPGEVKGTVLAGLVVRTAKALGIRAPRSGLSLTDRACRIGDYRADFFGLGLRENP
ncbi:hypothetical protein WEH80_10495 [Actinomycetes bacterium KLBMP 9759]